MANRSLTSAMNSEVESSSHKPVIFVQLDYDSGTSRYWSGFGELSWNSQTWLGAGNLGSMDKIEETTDLRATGTKLGMSGIPSEMISLILGERSRGRTVKIWLGFFDEFPTVKADPVLIFSGRIDNQGLEESAEAATIEIHCENKLKDLKRPRELRWTDQQQKNLLSTDKGCEYVADLQNKEISWGR